MFTEQPKPFEVELCVAEVAKPGKPGVSQLYRISYDGSISDETRFLVMGGATEAIAATLRDKYESGLSLADALTLAVDALATPPPAANGAADTPRRELTAGDLEVAILDHNRPRRAFRRLPATTVEELLAQAAAAPAATEPAAAEESTTTEDQAE